MLKSLKGSLRLSNPSEDRLGSISTHYKSNCMSSKDSRSLLEFIGMGDLLNRDKSSNFLRNSLKSCKRISSTNEVDSNREKIGFITFLEAEKDVKGKVQLITQFESQNPKILRTTEESIDLFQDEIENLEEGTKNFETFEEVSISEEIDFDNIDIDNLDLDDSIECQLKKMLLNGLEEIKEVSFENSFSSSYENPMAPKTMDIPIQEEIVLKSFQLKPHTIFKNTFKFVKGKKSLKV